MRSALVGPWMGAVSGGHLPGCGRGVAGSGPGTQGLLLALLLLLAQAAVGKPLLQQNVEQSKDGCDRTIWSSPAEPRAVNQLSVRCAEGVISWQQADGALRVQFNTPVPLRPGRQIETCFTISSHLLKVIISRDMGTEGMQPQVMLTKDYPRTAKDLCLRSEEPISLFLETQPGEPNMALGYIKIHYDVTSVSKNEADNMEECRPCTEEELLVAVCSMDFVVSGQMNSVLHSSILEQTTIDISVDKVYRQKIDHFKNSFEPSRLRRDVTRTSESSRSALTAAAEAELDSSHGRIVAPYKCGIRYGKGDFLFTGRMRLGRALLQCAPRLEEFNELWTKATREGQNPCNLD